MSVVACPRCNEEVTVPNAPASARVSCPLCGESYLLSEALLSRPPMLVVHEVPEEKGSFADHGAEVMAISGRSEDMVALMDHGEPAFPQIRHDQEQVPLADYREEHHAFGEHGQQTDLLPDNGHGDFTLTAAGSAEMQRASQQNELELAFGQAEPLTVGELPRFDGEGTVRDEDDFGEFVRTAPPPDLEDEADMGEIELEPAPGSHDPFTGEAPVAEAAPAPRPAKFNPTPRRKTKGPNPLIEMLKVVAGGVVAVPLTLLILLWLPGKLQRDPFKLGPQIAKYAPWLVPENLRTQSNLTSSNPSTAIADKGNQEKTKPSPATPPTEKRETIATGFQPGSQFEQELKNPGSTGTTEVAKVPEKTSEEPAKPEEPAVEPASLVGGDSEPAEMELPTTEPKTDVTDPKPETDPASTTPEPTTESSPDPSPETTPPTTEEPVEPAAPADDAKVAQAKEAFAKASQGFADAAGGTDKDAKRSAAMALYQSVAELAAVNTDFENFETIVSDPQKQQIAGVLAGNWLDNAERSTDTIVLIGTVKSCTQAGDVYEITMELPGSKKRAVTVVSRFEQMPEDRLFVIGEIVDSATDSIEGYKGSATTAVKLFSANKLAAP